MPFINISTSKKVNDTNTFLNDIAILIANLTNKPRRFVMVKLEDNSQMYFDDGDPCCFLEIKSIGNINPGDMAKPICDFVYQKMGIPLDKVYICFHDVPASTWAWNAKTFG